MNSIEPESGICRIQLSGSYPRSQRVLVWLVSELLQPRVAIIEPVLCRDQGLLGNGDDLPLRVSLNMRRIPWWITTANRVIVSYTQVTIPMGTSRLSRVTLPGLPGLLDTGESRIISL